VSFRTVDLVDAHQNRLRSCEVQFRQYGGRRRFSGSIRTLRTFEDNALIREILSTPGNGAVLVVDGAGSLRTALVGDVIASLGVQNGWAGLVLWGAVRDVEELAKLDIGIKAIGSNPMRSGKNRYGEIDIPVSFGGAIFRPGASLYSDDDGMVVCDEPLL
jgi:regulator of ribonuclease activity A